MKISLIALAVTTALTAASSAYAGSIEFSGVKASETNFEKSLILSSEYVNVDNTLTNIGYNTIVRAGDELGGGTFGMLVDVNGDPILNDDGTPRIDNSHDFSSLIMGKNEKIYMVSHIESRPAAMYLTELKQSKDGKLTATKTRPLDFSDVNGGYTHCAGSVSPWGTHLGSEEYEPNAAKVDPATGSIDGYYDSMADYFNGDLLAVNPYDYGYVIEVGVKNFKHASVEKHYAMGRLSIELPYVMPNEKTVYITDDGTNVGLYRFEADKAGDLSSGTLYAAKWIQTSDEGVGSADLEWINLGHASDDKIKRYLDNRTTFNQIFDATAPTEEGCPVSFTEINTSKGHECLSVKDGMETAASRMETRRYAAMMGATTEWRKMEGLTFNPETKQMYIAMSAVAYGMEDNAKKGSYNTKYDIGGYNDIRVNYNLCGAVYALDVDENYVARNMYGLVSGHPTQANDPSSDLPAYDADGPFAKNKCDLDGIANPDNITFMPGYNTLIIGEDTGSGHQNDMIWSYNTETGEMTRIETTPYGSETTSPYFYPNINGFAYLMSVVQHPYGESDKDKLVNDDDARAYTGYFGPFPAMGEGSEGKHKNRHH